MIEKCKMRKFIYSEVSCFLPELFQRFSIDFKWLHLSFHIQWTPFTNTCRSEAAIKNLGKILKNQLQRSSFLSLLKLKASNCRLLKMDSIRGFSRTLFKLYTVRYGLNLQNTYFREDMLMAACTRFRSSCFSEHGKVDALFIKQPN